jgi:hypothetical protein
MKSIALATVLLSMSPSADYPLMHILRNVHKVKSFEGTLVQSGLVPGADVKAQIQFREPNRFRARIDEPAAWAGTALAYDGTSLVSYYPQLRWAVRVTNLALPTGKDADRVVEYQYGRDLATFDYHIFGTSKIAGYPVITLWHTAKNDDAFDRKGWTKVYDPFSFPLAAELHFKGADYAYRWEAIAFNRELDEKMLEPSMPEGTFVSEWDLAAAPIDEAAMRKEAASPIVLLESNGLGLARSKIIRAPGPLTAFCVRYDRGPHFLLVIAHAQAGLSVPAYGLPIDVGVGGRLIPGPVTSSYAFVAEGTYYTLIGNLPIEELLAIATRMAKRSA